MKRYLLFFALLLMTMVFAQTSAKAQCATTTVIEKCNQSGGNVIRVFFMDGQAPDHTYILYSIPSFTPVYPLNPLVTANFSPTLPPGAVAGVEFDGVPNGTYVVYVSYGGQTCPSTSADYIVVGGLGISVNSSNALTGSLTIQLPDCNPTVGIGNGQLQLTVSKGAPSYNVTWTGPTTVPPVSTTPPGNTIAASGGTLTTTNNLDAGSYTAQITDADNCLLSVNISLPIATQPDAGPDNVICGPSAVLAGNSPGGGEIGTWTVVSGTGSFSPNANAPGATVSGLSAGVNTLRWTIVDIGLVCAPGSSNDVDITSNPSPTVVITDPAAVCSPATVDLTAAAVTAGSTAGLTFTYWTDAGATTALGTPNAVNATGTYFIKGTTASNCSDIKSVNVTINPSPTVVITDPAAVCSPATVDLTAAAVTAGSTAGLTFTYWTDAGATTALGTPNAVNATGTYFIKGTTASNCSDIKSVNVTINPSPTVVITDPAAVCSPATVDLTAAAVTTGSTAGLTFTYWTDAGATTPLGSPNAVSATGMYYIKGTTASNCSDIKSVNVTINPSPTVVITDPAAVCSPATVDLTAAAVTAGSTAGLTFTYWTDAGATTALGTPNAVNATGTYFIKGTTASNCSDIKSVNVTINPSPTVVITDPAAVCSPATVDLTAAAVTTGSTAGLTFTYWTDAGATTPLGSPNAVSATGMYFIKGTTASNCSDIKSVNVTINPSPTVVITDPAAVCSPATVDLTAAAVTAGSTVGLTFTYWTDAGATTALGTPNAVNATGTYFIKGTTASNCSDIKSVNVTINPSPTVVITDPAAVCSPATVDLTAAAVTTGSTAGLTFTYWTDAGATTALGTPNAVNATGTYFIKGTTASNCSDIKSVNVTINPSPTVVITDPAAVCSPATVDLTAAAVTTGSTAGLTFTYWTDAGATTPLGSPNAVNATGTYFIKGTTASNCSDIKSVNVTINPSPTVVITDPAAVCSPATVDLTAAAVTTGSTAGLTFTYWTDAGATTALGTPNAVNATGTYFIKGTTASNCSDIKSVNVTINPSPTVVITDPAAVCSPATVDLTAAAVTTGSTAGLTFTYWTDAGATTALGTPNAVNATGTYFIKGTTASNCSDIKSVNVTINPSPTVVITDPAAVCSPATVDLTAAAVTTGSTAGLTFTYWTDAGATTPLGSPNAVNATGTYFIKGTTASNCSDIKSVNVTINPSPTVVITDPAAVCSPATVDLTAAAVTTGSTAGLTFTYWTDAGATTALGTPNAVNATGTYFIKGTTASNCSDIKSVNVTINPSPTVVITDPAAVCSPATVDLTAAAVTTGSTAGLTFTYWTDAGATTALGTPNAVNATGTYFIKGTTASNCSDIKSVNVTINALPVVSTPSSSLCMGSTMTLSPASGGTWISSDPTKATVTNAGLATGVAVGTVTFTFTDGTTNCSNTTASVTINPLPSTPTGGDVTVCFDGAPHTGSATPGAGESIVWYTAASGGSATTAPTGATVGTYVAFAAAKNTTTGCESTTRTQVTVKINALPTVTFTTGATAICSGSSSTYTTQAGQANYTWSVTGGSITSGGTATDNTATIQWTSTGSVSVNYQDVNTCAAASPTSQAVTVDTPPTVAGAGSDQTNVCGTVSLGANSTTPPETGSWSFAPSGNVDGNGSIINPTSPTSGFNGTPGKTYTLRWTISNGTCPSSSDDVAISFDPTGVTPSAAGPDQNQCNNGSFTLAGNIATSGTGSWSIVGSTNGASITSSSSNNSTVTGLTLGTSVTLRWSISNGASCTSSDDVALSNNDNPTSATAGSDKAVCGTSTTLAGNTPTIGTGAWSITSGTGGSITNTADPASVFTGIQGNSYTLRWTVSNGACSPSFDDVDITFDKTPTTAVAGPDILNACGTISLSANNPTVGVGQWTISSNPDNLGNVATPSSNLSNFNGSAGITYDLTWTITNGSCPNSTDDVQIQYSPTGPTAADAGADQNICGITTTLSGNTPAVGTGQWSFDTGGNPDGLGVIADVNNQSSGFSGTVGQTYKLVWTIASGTCNSIDQVSIQFNAPPTNSNAGTDQGICGTSTTLAANAPSIGTGAWSISSVADGLGVIANVNNPLSGFSGTAGQTYVLTWTISSGTCTPSTNDVQIAFKDIALTVFNTNYCQNAGILDLTTIVSATPPGGTLTFTGTQVSGSNFDPTGLSGVQSISVKYDQSGCSLTKSLLINVLLPTNPACSGSGGGGGCSVPVISKQDICSGSDGKITITSVSGGQAPYQYSVDNGANWQNSNIFASLASGNYSVLVKDNVGCTSTVNTIVIAYNISGLVSKTDVTTCTGSDGKINITNIQGGSGSYIYSIDGGGTFPFSSLPISGLAAGTYSVVIKDNVPSGCISGTTSITISLPTSCTGGGINCGAFTITATDTRPTCAGQDDGTITISVSGGSPNYTVTLSDPSQSFNQAMTGPGPFTFGVGPSGGLSPSLTYQYTVLDGVGNTCMLPYSLPIQTNVQATAAGFVDAKCFNQAVGQATVTVNSGGTSPYEYSLDAGATWTQFTSPVTITNLMPAPAPYSILVRDDASDLCPAQVSVTINNAVADITTSFTNTDASCSNNDGTIQVGTISGGTGPYTYSLDSVDYATLPANNTFTGLAGGIHKFTVIDAIGCSKYFKTTINFPGLVNFTTFANPASCSGNGNDGSIYVTIISSGTFDVGYTTDPTKDPVSFQTVVSSGAVQVPFNGLSHGFYYVVAKPIGALCKTQSLGDSIRGPVAVDFDIIPQDFTCFEKKGVVSVAGIKGSSQVNYTYQIITAGNIIQGGIITQLQALPGDTINYTGLAKGNYQMILFQDQSSSSGCSSPISSSYKSFSIDGPTNVSFDTVSVTRIVSERFQASGSMTIVLENTFAPEYLFNLKLLAAEFPSQNNKHNLFDSTWVQLDASTSSVQFEANNLYAGTYKLSLIDGIGCERIDTLKISVSTKLFVPNVFTPNNDGKNDNFEIVNLPDKSSIVITNRWGKEVFSGSNFTKGADGYSSVVWNGGAESDGIYYYSLTADGKVYTGWIEILHPSY